MGGVPSRAAQSRVGKRNSGFARLVLTDPGYGREESHPGEYLSCLGRGLSEAGHDLFLSAIPDAHSELSVIHKIVSTRRADGLILGWSGEAAPCGPPQDQGFRFANRSRRGAESARMTGWALTASLPLAQPSRCFARWANAVLRC